MPKTSLQKSHSKWSNFKLTSLSVLASFFSCAIWIVLIFKENIKNEYLFYIPLILCVVLFILTMTMFSKFKR